MRWSIYSAEETPGGTAVYSALCLSADGQDSAGMLSARLNRITDWQTTDNILRWKVLVQYVPPMINLQGISTHFYILYREKIGKNLFF